jgi:hypothetical protein
MFDRTIVHQAPDHIRAEITVTEKRAPTDDSVRLLREMEAKAKAEVIKAVAINDNLFNGVIHTMFDALSYRTTVRLVYSMNGKKLTTDYHIDDSRSLDDSIAGLIDAVARDIAVEILRKPISAAMKANHGIFGSNK